MNKFKMAFVTSIVLNIDGYTLDSYSWDHQCQVLYLAVALFFFGLLIVQLV
jgi:hypothetical protein